MRKSFLAPIGIPFIAVTILFASAFKPERGSNSLLGQGRGVDHVGIVVRDLGKARHDYERLGFNVTQGGHFPGGLSNSAVLFDNKGYLELLSATDEESNSPDIADIIVFAKKHEGAMFLGLNVSSARDTTEYLRAHNFDVKDPEPGSLMKESETKLPPPQWYTVETSDKPNRNKLTFHLPIFFIEYLDAAPHDKTRNINVATHSNTAIGIRAVWFAVHDSQAHLGTLRRGGFDPKVRETHLLHLRGSELSAGSGSIVLLASKDKGSAVGKYLSDHDEGIIALSIEVADLTKARRLAESAVHSNLRTYNGAFGRSFLLAPDVTHGVWLEMFQR